MAEALTRQVLVEKYQIVTELIDVNDVLGNTYITYNRYIPGDRELAFKKVFKEMQRTLIHSMNNLILEWDEFIYNLLPK